MYTPPHENTSLFGTCFFSTMIIEVLPSSGHQVPLYAPLLNAIMKLSVKYYSANSKYMAELALHRNMTAHHLPVCLLFTVPWKSMATGRKDD
jgi:hypothetical protein